MSAFCLLKSARMWRCWLSIILIGLTLLPRPTLCGKREGLYSKHYRQGDRLIVKYAIDGTAGGLVNQLLCHIGAFMFAVPLNAEIALPSALSRSTYNNSWWQQEWKYRPLRTLLDVDDLVRYWKRRGILVHEVVLLPLCRLLYKSVLEHRSFSVSCRVSEALGLYKCFIYYTHCTSLPRRDK